MIKGEGLVSQDGVMINQKYQLLTQISPHEFIEVRALG